MRGIGMKTYLFCMALVSFSVCLTYLGKWLLSIGVPAGVLMILFFAVALPPSLWIGNKFGGGK